MSTAVASRVRDLFIVCYGELTLNIWLFQAEMLQQQRLLVIFNVSKMIYLIVI